MNVEMEKWRPVAGFEGLYEVSDFGRVRGLPRKYRRKLRILRPRPDRQGYMRVTLYPESGVPNQQSIHRLVCRAFLGEPPPDRQDVNHMDGRKDHNQLSNLEWTNDSLNVTHAFRVLKVRHAKIRPWLGKFGKDHHASKPVIQISPDGVEVRFEAAMDAARKTGLSFKHISACCRGQRPRHGGFQWRFAEVPK